LEPRGQIQPGSLGLTPTRSRLGDQPVNKEETTIVNVRFIASMAVIAPDPAESRRLYIDALGLPLEASEGDDYFHSEQIAGSNHFGVWPLAQAAQACFGTPIWPDDRPVPQASVEFEVESRGAVQAAADELRADGFMMLHEARMEPWGQTVARLQSPEGAILGISFAPWMHDGK
jgi:catechol 2,3-dioxygenase-like lactoylglutathione lyase family enzyme